MRSQPGCGGPLRLWGCLLLQQNLTHAHRQGLSSRERETRAHHVCFPSFLEHTSQPPLSLGQLRSRVLPCEVWSFSLSLSFLRWSHATEPGEGSSRGWPSPRTEARCPRRCTEGHPGTATLNSHTLETQLPCRALRMQPHHNSIPSETPHKRPGGPGPRFRGSR